ncbi:3TM-type holin [Hydrogenimonas sp.]
MGLMDFNLDNVGSLLTSAREAITGEKIADPIEAKKIEAGLAKLQNDLLSGQIRINKEEAKSKFLFVAGWRPAIGWVAAVSLALMYIPKAIVMTAIWTYQCYEIISTAKTITNVVIPAFPSLGAMDIIGLVTAMLGVAGMRTYEKKFGVASIH